MGVVVAARHVQLEQRVAHQVHARADALDNAEAVEPLRCARRAPPSRLKSEHVARVLDVGRLETGAPYMVMEFLEGDDLGAVRRRSAARCPSSEAVDFVLQACEAVAEAHALGIVHRDLKPANLFLDARASAGSPGQGARLRHLQVGSPRRRPRAKLTRTRAMLGSPLYMSPEQMRSSRDVDARRDVWALGVILYELLDRPRPVRRRVDARALPEGRLGAAALARRAPSEVRALVAVVERCLEKDRNSATPAPPSWPGARAVRAAARSSVFTVRPPFESMRNASLAHVPAGVHAASQPDPGAYSGGPRTTFHPGCMGHARVAAGAGARPSPRRRRSGHYGVGHLFPSKTGWPVQGTTRVEPSHSATLLIVGQVGRFTRLRVKRSHDYNT